LEVLACKSFNNQRLPLKNGGGLCKIAQTAEIDVWRRHRVLPSFRRLRLSRGETPATPAQRRLRSRRRCRLALIAELLWNELQVTGFLDRKFNLETESIKRYGILVVG